MLLFQPYGLWLSMYIVYCRWYNSEHCEKEERMNYSSPHRPPIPTSQENQEFLHNDFYVCFCVDGVFLSNTGYWILINDFRF